MLENSETPGFGKKAEEPSYMKIFWDYGASRAFPKTKQELREVDAVSGSTITFTGISKALSYGAEWLKGTSKNGPKENHS